MPQIRHILGDDESVSSRAGDAYLISTLLFFICLEPVPLASPSVEAGLKAKGLAGGPGGGSYSLLCCYPAFAAYLPRLHDLPSIVSNSSLLSAF